MRISDWSSDVCSSDLDVRSVAVYAVPDEIGDRVMVALELRDGTHLAPLGFDEWLRGQPDLGTKWLPSFVRVDAELPKLSRSEERRVGKESGSTCRSGGPPYHYKKNKTM